MVVHSNLTMGILGNTDYIGNELVLDTVRVWDNPDHVDRYTIVIEKGIFAMSELPNNPQGINQFCGSLDSRTPPLTKAWGEPIDIKELPEEVREAIIQRKEIKE